MSNRFCFCCEQLGTLAPIPCAGKEQNYVCINLVYLNTCPRGLYVTPPRLFAWNFSPFEHSARRRLLCCFHAARDSCTAESSFAPNRTNRRTDTYESLQVVWYEQRTTTNYVHFRTTLDRIALERNERTQRANDDGWFRGGSRNVVRSFLSGSCARAGPSSAPTNACC